MACAWRTGGFFRLVNSTKSIQILKYTEIGYFYATSTQLVQCGFIMSMNSVQGKGRSSGYALRCKRVPGGEREDSSSSCDDMRSTTRELRI